MRNRSRTVVASIVVLASAALPLAGQGTTAVSKAARPKLAIVHKLDFGLTYTTTLGKLSATSGPEFVMPGGSLDVVYPIGKRLPNFGIALDLSGQSAQSVAPGVNLSQIAAVAGPRYTRTFSTSKGKHVPTFYGQTLIGYARGFNSIFPTAGSVTQVANSVAFQLGGGINLPLNQHFGLRLFEADYVITRFPNNNDDFQGNARLSAGFTFHF